MNAVVGHPIAHSLSPLLHNTIYTNEGIDAEMTAIDAESIEPVIEMIRTTPLGLTAVTLPHKQSIMPLLDNVDAVANEIGAVNTVINREGRLTGYNTDIVGIAAALKDVELRNKAVLVVGAGGAAQPVAYHLEKNGAQMYCYSRDLDKTHMLCERFGGTALETNGYSSLDIDVVINATPLGLHTSDALPFPVELVKPTMTVFDLIYTPTQLQKMALEKGARVITGLPMFIAQGLEQEKLWLGREILDKGYSTVLQLVLQK